MWSNSRCHSNNKDQLMGGTLTVPRFWSGETTNYTSSFNGHVRNYWFCQSWFWTYARSFSESLSFWHLTLQNIQILGYSEVLIANFLRLHCIKTNWAYRRSLSLLLPYKISLTRLQSLIEDWRLFSKGKELGSCEDLHPP